MHTYAHISKCFLKQNYMRLSVGDYHGDTIPG